MQHRSRPILVFVLFILMPLCQLMAQSRMAVETASLHPGSNLVWQRSSPTPQKLDGPVLYQLLFNASGVPGTVPVFDSNPRHLINSPIRVGGGNVAIGGLSISGGTGIITFANGQTFPGNSGGTVTSLTAGAGIALIPSPITTTGSVSIADGGVTAAKIGSGAALNGEVLVTNGSGNASWQTLTSSITNGWGLGGNAGTGCTASPCTTFIGTTDNTSFEVRVNNIRAFRLEPQIDANNGNSPAPNVIGGYSGNLVNGSIGATIAGGGEQSFVNTVSGSFGTVGGGIANTASGGTSTLSGGRNNTASGGLSTVAGGASNTASGYQATVSGGALNIASTISATVVGGAGNTASGLGSTVAGGEGNTASGDHSFAAGLLADTNHHQGAFVWGDNSTNNNFKTVLATADNQFMARATGGFQFITGVDGSGNPDPTKTVGIAPNSGVITFAASQTFPASGVPAWLLGGNFSTGCTTSPCADFLGTTDNDAMEFRVNNQRAYRIEPATDTQFGSGFSPNVIAGFSGNSVTGMGTAGATIAGGGGGASSAFVNTASSSFATVGGGAGNTARGSASIVAGGTQNLASGGYSIVAGGHLNTAIGDWSAVAGGYSNTASGPFSTVAGYSNNASGNYSTVAGGGGNSASGDYSVVAGGYANSASGSYSTVAAGFHNTAKGIGSFAAGEYTSDGGQAGVFLWGDNSTATVMSATGPNQFLVRATNGVTFYTISNLSTGVTVANGGGSWSSVSDRNVKDNVVPVDTQALLAQVAALPVTTWNYKSQDAAIRHIGPMAQDFYSAFNVGEDDKHITDIDEGGVALAAIQGLNQKLEEDVRQLRAQGQDKDLQISEQQQQIDALQQQMRAMMTRVGAVEKTSAAHARISLVSSSR